MEFPPDSEAERDALLQAPHAAWQQQDAVQKKRPIAKPS
jgi:hypothetical protein